MEKWSPFGVGCSTWSGTFRPPYTNLATTRAGSVADLAEYRKAAQYTHLQSSYLFSLVSDETLHGFLWHGNRVFSSRNCTLHQSSATGGPIIPCDPEAVVAIQHSRECQFWVLSFPILCMFVTLIIGMLITLSTCIFYGYYYYYFIVLCFILALV